MIMDGASIGAQSFKVLLDVPSKKPNLDYDIYALAFKHIIEKSHPRFAIGIFGDWGSGKTTLMEAIEAKLNKNNIICVWFNAWRYEKEEHLIIPLLDTVREALVEWDRAQQKSGRAALETAATIGKVIHSLLAGFNLRVGVPGTVDVSFDANKALAESARIAKEDREAEVPRSFYHAAFRALNNAFESFVEEDAKRRIVIFVDDLDRCLPDGALEVLESMKLFFDLEGFVFVVGLDRKVVELAVEAKYAKEHVAIAGDQEDAHRIRGADYIDKIFQVPFDLFPVAVGEINSLLDSIIKVSRLPKSQAGDLRDTVKPHLRFLVEDSGINPREIKRYINAYTLLIKLKPNLWLDVVLAMLTIQSRLDWELVYRNLRAWRGRFIDALREQVHGQSNALENLAPELREIPPRFMEYVGPNGPAKRIIDVQNIDDYIYAGEATHSRFGPGLSDLVREVTILRGPLRDAARSTPENEQARNQVSISVKQLRDRVLRFSSGRPVGFSNAILRRLDDLTDVLGELPLESSEQREPWLRGANKLVDQTLSDIEQWSRWG